MIELKNVSKYYYQNGMIASGISRVNLKLDIGEFVVITGESGSGKSTLLNVLSGLDSYEEGEMYINGEETSHYTEINFENYRRKYIGNIFQTFNLVNSYTVYQNVELVLLLNGEKKKNVKRKILDIIETVGLTKFKNTKVSKLSGGQKQRVAIARALAKETPIIVADEPTGNLDSKSAVQIMKLLHKISKDKLVIIVTHNKEQVEEYATRLIQMHDGRVLEDKKIEKIDSKQNIAIKNYKNITILNRIRLGIRNTFNIVPKFLLILLVFLFISATLLFEYSSFAESEAKLKTAGENYIFSNNNLKRIVIKKNDLSQISADDLATISSKQNVAKVISDDILLDSNFLLRDTKDYYYIDGNLNSLELFDNKIDFGRMPESDDEIIIASSSYEWLLQENSKEVLDREFYLSSSYNDEDNSIKVKLVGIKKSENYNINNNTIYFLYNIINKLRFTTNENYSTKKVLFENKYHNSSAYESEFRIFKTDKVPSGSAYISDDYRYMCKNEYCINHQISIIISNIYYSDQLDLRVTKMYTKYNYKKLLGVNDYEYMNGAIFINSTDYNRLFDRDTYQSSVFVDDEKNLSQVNKELKKLGYKTLVIKDTLINNNKDAAIMIQMISVIVTIILVITLFFISYFVIKLILKSRSIYYTTIRILGSTKSIAKQILNVELFTNATIAYLLCILAIYLTKVNVLTIKPIKDLLPYITIEELVCVYLILILMSQLISNRFARKLFKHSVMKTMVEEVEK